mmetsp:Transcript_5249/g.12111  ORF Transcript_5249/g.12111 Transcript_5249/m.12111 type:complete len:176 (+) Transcript_5249:338-865(+)
MHRSMQSSIDASVWMVMRLRELSRQHCWSAGVASTISLTGASVEWDCMALVLVSADALAGVVLCVTPQNDSVLSDIGGNVDSATAIDDEFVILAAVVVVIVIIVVVLVAAVVVVVVVVAVVEISAALSSSAAEVAAMIREPLLFETFFQVLALLAFAKPLQTLESVHVPFSKRTK